MKKSDDSRRVPPTEAAVRDYLLANPEFFVGNADMLPEIVVPHLSGGAVSLIEKQVAVLRQRNTELRGKLDQLLANARENDRLFERTKRLVLALLECNDLADLVDALHFHFDKEFNIPFARLVLFGDDLPSCNTRVISRELAEARLGRHLSTTHAVSGRVDAAEIAFLFDKDASKVGSAALATIGISAPLGVLAIGSASADRYQASTGTLFLGHLAEVLSRLLPRLLV